MSKDTYNDMRPEPDIGHDDCYGLNICVSPKFAY